MQGAGEFNPKEFDGETRFRSYALRTSQTIKKIINIVPTTPYPSIVASSDSKIVGFRIPVASSLNHMSRGICSIRHIIPIIRGVLLGKALSDLKQRQDPPVRKHRSGQALRVAKEWGTRKIKNLRNRRFFVRPSSGPPQNDNAAKNSERKSTETLPQRLSSRCH
jgi:hypothetical protein